MVVKTISKGSMWLGLIGMSSLLAPPVLADLNDGLVAYYPFEDTINDATSNANHGIVNGVLEYVEGISGQAARFNGTQGIKLPIKLNGIADNQYLTIAFWGKANTKESTFITNANYGDSSTSVVLSATNIGIVSRSLGELWWNGYCPGANAVIISGELSVPEHCTSTKRPTIYDFGHSEVDYTAWHHYVLTYDNNVERVYIDGNLVAEVEIGADQIGGYNGSDKYPRHDEDSGISCNNACFDRSLNIGVLNNAFSYPVSKIDGTRLNGLIDELRIYNRALSESEIGELYQLGSETTKNYEDGLNEGIAKCQNDPASCGITILPESGNCSSDIAAVIGEDLSLHVSKAQYNTLTGTQILWVDLIFGGANEAGDLTWILSDYGEVE